MITYSEKLRDPRWQRKRLKIMERDDFQCMKCMDSESTLNVHHCYYDYGKEPWDYPSKSLITLCEKCHKIETEIVSGAKEDLIKILCQHGLLSDNFDSLSSAFLKLDFIYPDQDVEIIKFAFSNMWEEMKNRYLSHEKESE